MYDVSGLGGPQTPPTQPVAPPPPTPGSPNGRYEYLGCFNDKRDRALPLRIAGRFSVSQCNTACSNRRMRYSGRQYNGECYCGNGNYAKHGSSNQCGACNGANVGAYLSCVYENTSFGSNPSPNPPPGPSPIDPGDLKVIHSSTGLKLSEGLKVRLIASADTRVALTNGRFSQERFFKDPDGAAVFPRPGGGWYYVINSEQWNRNSGVSTLVFNANGQVEDYQVRIKGTYRNCGGGKTPWGTWVSCEEYANGQCIQVCTHKIYLYYHSSLLSSNFLTFCNIFNFLFHTVPHRTDNSNFLLRSPTLQSITTIRLIQVGQDHLK